jgi:hypothetical protein
MSTSAQPTSAPPAYESQPYVSPGLDIMSKPPTYISERIEPVIKTEYDDVLEPSNSPITEFAEGEDLTYRQ